MPSSQPRASVLNCHSVHFSRARHTAKNPDGTSYERGPVPPAGKGYSLLERTRVFVKLFRAKTARSHLRMKRYRTSRLDGKIRVLKIMIDKMFEPCHERLHGVDSA